MVITMKIRPLYLVLICTLTYGITLGTITTVMLWNLMIKPRDIVISYTISMGGGLLYAGIMFFLKWMMVKIKKKMKNEDC